MPLPCDKYRVFVVPKRIFSKLGWVMHKTIWKGSDLVLFKVIGITFRGFPFLSRKTYLFSAYGVRWMDTPPYTLRRILMVSLAQRVSV